MGSNGSGLQPITESRDRVCSIAYEGQTQKEFRMSENAAAFRAPGDPGEDTEAMGREEVETTGDDNSGDTNDNGEGTTESAPGDGS